MEPAELRSLLTGALQSELGANKRRTFGWDAFYFRGRLFVLFSDDDFVGKWSPALKAGLRKTVAGVRPFMNDDPTAEASWLRVPMLEISDLGQAMALARDAAAYVNTPAGAPKGRRNRT
ncbi:MAG: hypothetical protein WEB00_04745 [Dehalococcoidia bacterium]